jgi:hypothetical protein
VQCAAASQLTMLEANCALSSGGALAVANSAVS